MLKLFFSTGKGDFAGKSFEVFPVKSISNSEPEEQGAKITVKSSEIAFLHCAA